MNLAGRVLFIKNPQILFYDYLEADSTSSTGSGVNLFLDGSHLLL